MEVRIVEFQSIDYYQALALRDRVLRAPLGLFFSGEDIRAEQAITPILLCFMKIEFWQRPKW